MTLWYCTVVEEALFCEAFAGAIARGGEGGEEKVPLTSVHEVTVAVTRPDPAGTNRP